MYPERLSAISSLTYASSSSPSTFIIGAERDDFIPAKGVYQTVQEAKNKGVDINLIKIPFTHHALDFPKGSLGSQVKKSIIFNYLDNQGIRPE